MDPRQAEADFNFYGEDKAPIEWDGERIPAMVSDAEAVAGPLETGLERKMISLRQTDLAVQPEPGDQVSVNLAPKIRRHPDFWEIEKVLDLSGEYDITIYRYHR